MSKQLLHLTPGNKVHLISSYLNTRVELTILAYRSFKLCDEFFHEHLTLRLPAFEIVCWFIFASRSA